jgi:Lon protease-like protein
MTHENQEFQNLLQSEKWQKMPADMFSFSVMRLLQLDPDMEQDLLEMTDPTSRLEHILTLLNSL